jgi:glycosyltransferase involved in cell wall biosynthesis
MTTLALCVPAYNAAEVLPRLLDSALCQTKQFDEIWVYDDCSIDDTAQVAENFGARVISGEVNRGCAFGKNVLAEQTACDWVHFHDADDALYPNFVEQSHNWFRNDAPDVVLFGYDWIDDASGQKLAVRRYDHEALTRDAIGYVLGEQIQSICGIYRRDIFLKAGGYDVDPAVLYNEDVAMHCQLARAGLKFAADQTVTVINYRRNNSMSSANRTKCARAHYHVLKKAAESLSSEYADTLATNLWQAAAVSATHLDWDTADAAVRLAVKLRGRIPARAGSLFRALCAVDPRTAIRVREYLIRLLKPQLRKNQYGQA